MGSESKTFVDVKDAFAGVSRHATIQNCWADYRLQVVPPDAIPEQLRQTELAFKSGFGCALLLLQQISMHLEEDEGVAILDRLQREWLAFAKKQVT